MPQISIIVPIYNVEPYLRGGLNSLLVQSFKDFEVICINDGSKDKSAEILAEYATKDSRIKVITQQNQGVSFARNAGLNAAIGEYIAFMDPDDYLHPQALELFYKIITQSNVDMVFGDCQITAETYHEIISDLEVEKVKGCELAFPLEVMMKSQYNIQHSVWNRLYRKSAIGEQRFIEAKVAEDLEFTALLLAKFSKIAKVDAITYFYYCRTDSAMNSNFNKAKIDSYCHVVKSLHQHWNTKSNLEYKALKWYKTMLLKVLLNKLRNAKKTKPTDYTQLQDYASEILKKLHTQKIISYQGLKLRNKWRLWKLLHKA